MDNSCDREMPVMLYVLGEFVENLGIPDGSNRLNHNQ